MFTKLKQHALRVETYMAVSGITMHISHFKHWRYNFHDNLFLRHIIGQWNYQLYNYNIT